MIWHQMETIYGIELLNIERIYSMAMMDKSENVPKQIQPVFDAVVVLTDAFCKEHLNEEYRLLARRNYCHVSQTSHSFS